MFQLFYNWDDDGYEVSAMNQLYLLVFSPEVSSVFLEKSNYFENLINTLEKTAIE